MAAALMASVPAFLLLFCCPVPLSDAPAPETRTVTVKRVVPVAAARVLPLAEETASPLRTPNSGTPTKGADGSGRSASAEARPMMIAVSGEDGVTVTELEEYIVGVVAAEMPAGFEREALSAQAVAARTYAYGRIKALGGSGCAKYGGDICVSSAHCQAWCSDEELRERWGDSYEVNMKKLRSAVEATEGFVMTWEGRPIDALYHASSGGMTEDVENVYGAYLPYLRSAESPDEGEEPETRLFTAAEFAAAVSEKTGRSIEPDTLSVTVTSRFESGRVERVEVSGAALTGRELRAALSLASANFDISVADGRVTVVTRGRGHGVGMSQRGANAMAKSGVGWQEILLHYYAGVIFEKVSL